MNRWTPSRIAASFLSLALLAQSTGAADIAPVAARAFPRPVPPAVRWMKARPALPVPLVEESRAVRLAERWGKPVVDAYALYSAADDRERLAGAPGVARVQLPQRLFEGHSELFATAVVLTSFFSSVFKSLRAPVYRSRMEGPWREGRGIRYRVTYLDSIGVSWSAPDGLHGYIPYRGAIRAPGAYPELFGRRLATYFAGDAARYEVEIENTGGFLGELRLWASEEEYAESGARGPAIREPQRAGASRVVALGPGRRIVLARSLRVGHGRAALNLEQTHLVIEARDVYGDQRVLADDPQAGVLDPPRF